MASFRIGGVPEHFNIPFHIAKEQKLYDNFDIIEFVSVPEGSGAMVSGLRSAKYDMIIALTECLVAEIEKGKGDIKLIGEYVHSPLAWGVCVHANGTYKKLDELEGKMFGISRYGSGSHIMADVMARQHGWSQKPKFHVCNNFAGLRSSLQSGEVDCFLWEAFTCSPYVDKKELLVIDEVPTPWPCFMAAMRSDSSAELVRMGQGILTTTLQTANQIFKANENNASINRIVSEFQLTPDNAHAWLSQVTYSSNGKADSTILDAAKTALLDSDVLKPEMIFMRSVDDYAFL